MIKHLNTPGPAAARPRADRQLPLQSFCGLLADMARGLPALAMREQDGRLGVFGLRADLILGSNAYRKWDLISSAMCERPWETRYSTKTGQGGILLRYGSCVGPVYMPPPSPVDIPPPGPVY